MSVSRVIVSRLPCRVTGGGVDSRSPLTNPRKHDQEGVRMKRLSAAVAILAVVVGVWAGYSIRSSGQQPVAQAQRSMVAVVRVKLDMIDAWMDFQAKQSIPALKKAGITQRDVYRAAYGPAGEFRVVTPIGKFAERDNPSPLERALGAAGAKTYTDTLVKMIASQTTYVIQSIPDASFDPQPDAIHKILVLSTVHVAPGRTGDYLS